MPEDEVTTPPEDQIVDQPPVTPPNDNRIAPAPTSAAESAELDLDVLAPKSVGVRFNGKVVQVHPPTLEQYMELTKLSKKLSELDPLIAPSDMGATYTELNDFIKKLAPEFGEAELNPLQITALFKLIGEIATPNDDEAIAELKKRGIELKTPEGQTPKDSASLPPSPAS